MTATQPAQIQENLETNFKQMIPFHGLLLSVVEYNGADYIPLRPIVELLGTQWKTAREKAFFGDNRELFGTQELNEPVFNALNTLRGAKKSVFILLEAGETYLMKTNTNQIRRHGSSVTADYLLKLQKEWRKALYDFENIGVAYKQKSFDRKKELKELLNARKLTSQPAEKLALSNMIADEFAALGYALKPDPQAEMDV